ncbi:unnamed protein product [Peniophora sp. CBMAI 1063]|nr:unnamed protein product [Peniophora sp. CBMAI 1063]
MESLANLSVCDCEHLRDLANQYMDAWLTDPSTENVDELNAALVANLAYSKYSPGDATLAEDVDKALDDYTVAVHANKSDDVHKNVIALYTYMAAHNTAKWPGYNSPKNLKRKVDLAQLNFTPMSHNNPDAPRNR